MAEIIIPQAVRNEFMASGTWVNLPSNEILVGSNEIDKHFVDIPQSLGEGERQAIAIAYAISESLGKNRVLVVTDDLKARRTCKRIGIRVIGTLGLIEFAKKHGILTKEEALSLLDMIPDTSLYITDDILREAQTKILQQ